MYTFMSEVLSIRIPKRLKREMERLKDIVNWKSEITTFLQERVSYYSRLKTLSEVRKILETHPLLPRGIAVRSVREDRDNR